MMDSNISLLVEFALNHLILTTCRASSCTKYSFTISGYTDVAAKNANALKSACDKQPVSVTVDAGIAW